MTTVTLKGEAALAQLSIADGDVSLSTESINLQRLRFTARSCLRAPPRLRPIARALGRTWPPLRRRRRKDRNRDRIGRGIRFRDLGKGWNVEGFGRQLITYGALPKEWGFAPPFLLIPIRRAPALRKPEP